MTTSSVSNPSLRISHHKDTPPYLICHVTVPGGRLHHVAGRGFVARHPDEASLHSAGLRPLHRSALRHAGDRGPRPARMGKPHSGCPPRQPHRPDWRRGLAAMRHLKRGGFPFGPVVRVDRPGIPDSFAIFNIEMKALSVEIVLAF